MKIKGSILFLLFLIISTSIYFFFTYLKENEINKHQINTFKQNQQDISNSFENLYSKEFFNTMYQTKETIKKENIKAFLQKKSKKINYYSSKNRSLNIYNKDALLLYSNHEEFKYNIKKQIPNKKIKEFLQNPKDETYIKIEESGVMISNLIPIYDDKLIGVVEFDIHFDEIAQKLKKQDIQTLFVLSKTDSRKVNINLSYSRQFIQGNYVINKNNDKYYNKIIEQNKIFNSSLQNNYNEKDRIVIVRKDIYQKNKKLIDVYLIKNIEETNFEDKSNILLFLNIIMMVLITAVALILYIISKSYYNRYILEQNEQLLKENAQLKTLSDKLDYNEKKLSNLFNLQPNIMFISNGVHIVQVNRRFMGFFRRYGTFDNFKTSHKDISELFEDCDMPNYISGELIEGKNWLEYILSNPKRLYKTIMSVDSEQHHFIIKVNEMEYVKNFHERYIVVAFVDITQDLESKKVKHDTSNEELDFTYSFEDSLRVSLNEMTNIIPTKQAIFKAQSNEYNGTHLLKANIHITLQETILNWDILLPAQSASYLHNLLNNNYDDPISTIIDENIEESSYIIVKNILDEFIEQLKFNYKEQLPNTIYTIEKNTHIVESNEIEEKNLYKFIMYIDNKEVEILIDFDFNSMKYIKQIQLLGELFG